MALLSRCEIVLEAAITISDCKGGALTNVQTSLAFYTRPRKLQFPEQLSSENKLAERETYARMSVCVLCAKLTRQLRTDR